MLAGAVAVVAALLVRGLPQLARMGLVLFTGILMAVVVHGLAAWMSNALRSPGRQRPCLPSGALETDQLDARQTLGGMSSVFATLTGALTSVLIRPGR